jgi:tetratricopeptide (TPR) repeat protein
VLPVLERSPLVGRDNELDRVRHWLTQSSTRRSGVLIVSGEAGIGKSRLAEETTQLAHSLGLVTARAESFEHDALVPYALFLDLLRTDLGDIAAPGALDPQDQRRKFNRTVTDAVCGLSANRPAFLILEDLHWCDEHSLDIIRDLARRTAAEPLLMMLTYRREEAPSTLRHTIADLRRARLAMEMSLRPLEPNAVEALIRGVFRQEQPVRHEFVDAIFALTDGNPFFVEEVLAALVASGDVFRLGGVWDRLPVHQLRVPLTIQDAVQRRAGLLSPAAHELLVPAAVVGPRFDFGLLEHITGLDEVTLLRLVKELVVAQLVVEEGPDEFAFRHALTREAVLVGLLTRERRTWHARVAEAIEQRGTESDAALAALAHHSFESGDWQRALTYAQQSGERARAVYATRAAVEHFSRALKAAANASTSSPPGLLRARGQAYETLGVFDSARMDYEEELANARVTGERVLECQSLLDLGFLWGARDYSRAWPYLEEALVLSRSVGSPTLVARSLNRVGNWLVNAGRPNEALPLHEEALSIFETTNERRGIAETTDLLGLAAAHSGQASRAVESYERAVTLYRELDVRTGLVTALVMLAEMCSDHPGSALTVPTADPDEAIRRAEEAVAVARSIEWRSGEAYALLGLAYCLTGKGAYGQALEAARHCLAIARDIEHHQWTVGGHVMLASVYLDLQAPTLAQTELDRADEVADAARSAYWSALVTAVRAAAFYAQGELARAGALIDSLPRSQSAKVNPMAALVLRADVERALASANAQRALDTLDEFLSATARIMSDSLISPHVWLLRGEVLRRLGHAAEAETVLKSVVEVASSRHSWPVVWRAHVALGQLARAAGRRLDAAAEFAAAHRIVERLAMDIPEEALPALGGNSLRRQFLTMALALVPQARPLTARRKAKEMYSGLTTREREVAALIARGKSNPEIAEILVIGRRTVESHIASIFAKLSCGSRAAVAAWAVDNGLTTRAR